MKKTRVVFRTGKKLGRTLAMFPDTLEGDEILAYDNHHYTASKSSIMKHTPRHGGRVERLALRTETSLQV